MPLVKCQIIFSSIVKFFIREIPHRVVNFFFVSRPYCVENVSNFFIIIYYLFIQRTLTTFYITKIRSKDAGLVSNLEDLIKHIKVYLTSYP